MLNQFPTKLFQPAVCFSSLAKPPCLKAAHPRHHSLYPAESAPPASLSSRHLRLTYFQHGSPEQPSSTPPCSSQQAPVPSGSHQTRTDHFTGRSIEKKPPIKYTLKSHINYMMNCVNPSQVLQPQQQRAVLSPQVTLATTPMVTLRNPAPSHIVLGQQRVQLKDLQPGEDNTFSASDVCVYVCVWSYFLGLRSSSRLCETTSF